MLSEEIFENPILFIALRTLKIKNFLKCLGIVSEYPILLLLNVGTYAKPYNEKYSIKRAPSLRFFLGKFNKL